MAAASGSAAGKDQLCGLLREPLLDQRPPPPARQASAVPEPMIAVSISAWAVLQRIVSALFRCRRAAVALCCRPGLTVSAARPRVACCRLWQRRSARTTVRGGFHQAEGSAMVGLKVSLISGPAAAFRINRGNQADPRRHLQFCVFAGPCATASFSSIC